MFLKQRGESEEELRDLIGCGVGRDVVVLGWGTKEKVADAAPGEVGLMSSGPQSLRDADRSAVGRCVQRLRGS